MAGASSGLKKPCRGRLGDDYVVKIHSMSPHTAQTAFNKNYSRSQKVGT